MARRGRRKVKTKKWPAPTRGWVTNEAIAAQDPRSATVMENWFPTQKGCRIRKGAELFATLDGPVVTMFDYETGSTSAFFASTTTSIFQITSPTSPTIVEQSKFAGQSNGYYSWQQFSTEGGDYLYAVNGANDPLLYDGTGWFRANDTTTERVVINTTNTTPPFSAGDAIIDTFGRTGTVDYIAMVYEFVAVVLISGGSGGTGTFQVGGSLRLAAGGDLQYIFRYDGTSPATLTGGVDPADLSAVWLFGGRLWFAEKDTLKAWYLAPGALGGKLAKLNLSPVFLRGGELLFGSSWSSDSGDGLDDRCVFVTTEGEVAVYSGTDPSSVDTWTKVGRYDIPKPLGKNAFLKVAGDLLILTKEGVIPITAVVSKDPAALSMAAVSRAIEGDWANEVIKRGTDNWGMVKWDERNLAFVSMPASTEAPLAKCFAVHLETGAWCDITGWESTCFNVFSGQAYFGTPGGLVLKADTGGSDNGALYVSKLGLAFDDFGDPGAYKMASLARATFLTATGVKPKLSCSADYITDFPPAPAAYNASDALIWDVSAWDNSVWDGVSRRLSNTRWQAIRNGGMALSIEVQVTTGDATAPNAELVAITAAVQVGDVVY